MTTEEARILAVAGRHTAAARLAEAFVRFHQEDTPTTFTELAYAITGACEELKKSDHALATQQRGAYPGDTHGGKAVPISEEQ